jgi:SMC interacting uncharacterized protein involved in chromosome segregation
MAETGNGVSASEFATVKAEVEGMRREMANISGQISGLVNTINERSKTPWATIISAMGVTLAVVVYGGGLAKEPIDDAITRLEQEVARIVPRGEHEQIWTSHNAQILAANHEREQMRADMQRQLDQLRTDTLRQVDELKAQAGSTYSLRDYIQRLTERIDTLEERALRNGAH